MPVQQTQSSFAKKLGVRVAQANAEHKDKPVDTGERRLPAGIKNGVAKLSTMYLKEQEKDDGKTPKGEVFFRASAIVVSPEMFNDERIAGRVTQVLIPMCDLPKTDYKDAVPFSEQYYEFQNLFKLLKVDPPNYGPKEDPDGTKCEAYYLAAMRALIDPKNPPVYIEFSTRGWTPKPSPKKPSPEEMVFETWHGLATFNGKPNPAAGVTVAQNMSASTGIPSLPPAATSPNGGTTSRATTLVQANLPSNEPLDLTDEVTMLVEVAMNDPEGATPDGLAATQRLEQLAWAAGATEEMTRTAADWGAVGEMALGILPESAAPTPPPPVAPALPTIGSRWNFAKRTKDGAKLKNNKGEEFPPQEVEITSINAQDQTCTVKTVRDGKEVTDLRTKKPVQVKFEWLEPLAY